jgi:hypothetical protein
MIQVETANIILGQSNSDRFTIKWGWFTLRLKIKLITARELIAISKEICQIKDIDQSQDMFTGVMVGASDLRYVSRIIAIATGTRFVRIVACAILRLPLKDIQTLFMIVRKQTDPERFFFIIAATGRMNLLKRQPEKLEEVKQSGDDLQ